MLVLRRREEVPYEHFRAPTWVSALGVVTCVFFASPLAGRPMAEYAIAGVLLGIGVIFWVVNLMITGRTRAGRHER